MQVGGPLAKIPGNMKATLHNTVSTETDDTPTGI